MLRQKIIEALKKITREEGVQIDIPENESFGDYSTNIAFVLSKKRASDPRKLAEEIVAKILRDKDIKILSEKIEVAGPGFINFWLSSTTLLGVLNNITNQKDTFGEWNLFENQKIMFEFAHPNTHKAFHIGHLRNIATGEALARLTEFIGAHVIRVNYQGDIGLHIAKAIWGITALGFNDPKDVAKRAEFLGQAYAKGATVYDEDKKAKEEINEINKNIYSKEDSRINDLYEKTRKWSLDYFDRVYKRVYTKFDRLYFESECAEGGKEIALFALKKGILEESRGAIIFPGKKYGLHDRVFVSGKGVPTYEAKDLALADMQFQEYKPDKILHIVGPEQGSYFQVLFKALEFIRPETKDREFHIPYGWVRLKQGKMSSRHGNVVLGEFLLDEAKRKIIEKYNTPEKIAEQIAIGAVKYSFLKTGLNQDIAFDINESISLEGNSGPYLQYTYARTHSVLRKSLNSKLEARNKSKIQNSNELNVSDLKNSNLNIVSNFDIRYSNLNSEELAVLRSFVHFPDIIESAAKSYSPNFLCNYLFDLAQKFNNFYNKYRIIDSENAKFRLALTAATNQIIKTGLHLLGIEAPERM